MQQWLYKIGAFISRFMSGRNGYDSLSYALLIFALIISMTARISGWSPLVYVGFAILLLCFFRIFSRNIQKRQAENAIWLSFWSPIKNKLFGKLAGKRQTYGQYNQAGYNTAKAQPKVKKDKKSYRYFKCSQCHTELRVPKGKCKVKVTCPNCKTQVIKKT